MADRSNVAHTCDHKTPCENLLALQRENRRLREAILQGHHVRGQSIQVLDETRDQLTTQNARFAAALDNMAQGLCMFDADHRLAVINRRFADIFRISTIEKLLDVDVDRLCQAVIHSGSMTRTIAEALFARPSAGGNALTTFACDLADGRSLAITRSAVTSGGWLITFEDMTERRKAESQLEHMALHDSLTDLPNRSLFRAHLDRQISASGGAGIAVLYLDLDRFKCVNDTLGHPVGDTLLRCVAERFSGCVREHDFIARLGGDEFAVVQGESEQPAQARALARRLLEVISAPYQIDGNIIDVGVSIGIALAPQDGVNADAILKAADLALYRAKSDGKGVFRFFEPTMNAEMLIRRQLEIDLRQAMAQRELKLYYQPLVDLSSGRVACFEALLRWDNSRRGIVLPGEFVPIAEEIGLIIPIGAWVLCTACREAASWPDKIKVAVNLSPVQFRDPHLVRMVRSALATSGLPPHRLELEVTESTLMQDSEASLITLKQLRELGIAIALDDFGTGYSSLSYLNRFPFDKIKIDQCFIRDSATKPEASAIIRSVVHVADVLGIRVTAEGVETRQQLEQMRLEGCTECQGYLFSRPCPSEQVVPLITELSCRNYACADDAVVSPAHSSPCDRPSRTTLLGSRSTLADLHS